MTTDTLNKVQTESQINDTRKGTLDAIRKAIGRMTTKGGQKTGR